MGWIRTEVIIPHTSFEKRPLVILLACLDHPQWTVWLSSCARQFIYKHNSRFVYIVVKPSRNSLGMNIGLNCLKCFVDSDFRLIIIFQKTTTNVSYFPAHRSLNANKLNSVLHIAFIDNYKCMYWKLREVWLQTNMDLWWFICKIWNDEIQNRDIDYFVIIDNDHR